MNKKFFLSWLILFVAWMAGSFVVHALLLHADYLTLPNLFRSETDSEAYMPFMLGAHVLLSGALVWIYRLGVQARPWLGQGVRFGLVVMLLTTVPTYLIYYAVQPMPGLLVLKQIVFDSSLILLLGVLVAFLYRDAQPGSH